MSSIFLSVPRGGLNKYGLTAAEALVLARIYNLQSYETPTRPAPGYADITSSQLCAELGIAPASMKTLKNRLIKRGLLLIVTAKIGDRRVRLHLTGLDLDLAAHGLRAMNIPAQQIADSIKKMQEAQENCMSHASTRRQNRLKNFSKINTHDSGANQPMVNDPSNHKLSASSTIGYFCPPEQGNTLITCSETNRYPTGSRTDTHRVTTSNPMVIDPSTYRLPSHITKILYNKIEYEIFYLKTLVKLCSTAFCNFTECNYPVAFALPLLRQSDLPPRLIAAPEGAAAEQADPEIITALQADPDALNTGDVFACEAVRDAQPCAFTVIACYLPALALAYCAQSLRDSGKPVTFPPDDDLFRLGLTQAAAGTERSYAERYGGSLGDDVESLKGLSLHDFSARLAVMEAQQAPQITDAVIR